MTLLSRIPRPHRWVFLATFLIATAFAVYTQHAWEDYYITYRSSKNLATGHGLVYNHGDRLHTFTSPLGVLLPALASLLTLNSSDAAALWLFRLCCIAALAGAATLVFHTLRQLQPHAPAAALLAAACVALDPKSVDFTINGMETGLLLFALALTFWAQFLARARRWLWLGVAWAGLMWTRPDAFLYIGLLAAGTWLFNRPAETGLTRREWIHVYALAGLVCTILYLPWFAGSWLYYGTPVPHTVTVKSLMSLGNKTAAGAALYFLKLPWTLWTAPSSAADAFLPAYHMFGGWSAALVWIARPLAFLAAFAWLLPKLPGFARAASFAFCGLHVYLGYYPYFPFPWYLPGTAILGFIVFAAAIAQLIAAARSCRFKLLPRTTALALVGLAGTSTAALLLPVARQMAAQQRFIENGARRPIGEYLHAHAAPRDSVFMESLGYIGFFSQLKTFDYPGLSSREVPAAVRRVGIEWALLINHLCPDWVVLRPSEIERLERANPGLLQGEYKFVREFSVADHVKQLPFSGRPWLEFDSRFLLFRREPLKLFPSEWGEVHAHFPPGPSYIDNQKFLQAHAPSRVLVPVPSGARLAQIDFGIPAGAYENPSSTDGAGFEIRCGYADGSETTLAYRYLDPARNPVDRGLQHFEIVLPPAPPNSSSSSPIFLILKADPRTSWSNDWTSWRQPQFQ